MGAGAEIRLIDWFDPGIAIFLALVCWVWYAGRMSEKIDRIDQSLGDHLSRETNKFDEIKKDHRALTDAVSRMREDLAAVRATCMAVNKRHLLIDEEEVDDE